MKILPTKEPPFAPRAAATASARMKSSKLRAWSVTRLPVVRGAMSLRTTSYGAKRASSSFASDSASPCTKSACAGRPTASGSRSIARRCPRSPIFCAAYIAQLPGAAPRSSTRMPGAKEAHAAVDLLELEDAPRRKPAALGLAREAIGPGVRVPAGRHSGERWASLADRCPGAGRRKVSLPSSAVERVLAAARGERRACPSNV